MKLGPFPEQVEALVRAVFDHERLLERQRTARIILERCAVGRAAGQSALAVLEDIAREVASDG